MPWFMTAVITFIINLYLLALFDLVLFKSFTTLRLLASEFTQGDKSKRKREITKKPTPWHRVKQSQLGLARSPRSSARFTVSELLCNESD